MFKTWFITGVSSGFGPQLTEILLARGDRVAATVRKADGAAEEVDDAHIEREFDTNLMRSIHVARAVIPQLRAQGGGRILQLPLMVGRAPTHFKHTRG